MSYPVEDRARPPFIGLLFLLSVALQALGVLNQPLGSILSAVQHHILDKLKQAGLYFGVYLEHARVYYCHVEASLYRMIQKHRVHCLADPVVAPE